MDMIISLIYTLSSLICTILAGKGKYHCFIFGILASILYSYLAFKNSLWGVLALNIIYYIPIDFIGFFQWKKNTNQKTKSVYKLSLDKKKSLILFILAIIVSSIFAKILFVLNDKSPLFDSFITIFSILGAYLAIKRALEQWLAWAIVNLLTVIMWVILIIQGSKTYMVAFLYLIYLILSIVFYIQWQKEIKQQEINSNPQ